MNVGKNIFIQIKLIYITKICKCKFYYNSSQLMAMSHLQDSGVLKNNKRIQGDIMLSLILKFYNQEKLSVYMINILVC